MAKSTSQKKSPAKAATKSPSSKSTPAKAKAAAAPKSAKTPAKRAKRAENEAASKSAAASAASKPEPRSAKPAAVPEKSPAPAPKPPAQPQESPELPLTRGKMTVFGGPKDRGLKPDDKLALPTGQHFVYERVRTLNPQSFYCSMRWEYRVHHMTPEEVKRYWANKKLAIKNVKTGISVVARAVDWGPHENTGFDVGVSPGTAAALGAQAGDEVEIALADPKDPLGPQ